jgi:hypothetical protein
MWRCRCCRCGERAPLQSGYGRGCGTVGQRGLASDAALLCCGDQGRLKPQPQCLVARVPCGVAFSGSPLVSLGHHRSSRAPTPASFSSRPTGYRHATRRGSQTATVRGWTLGVGAGSDCGEARRITRAASTRVTALARRRMQRVCSGGHSAAPPALFFLFFTAERARRAAPRLPAGGAVPLPAHLSPDAAGSPAGARPGEGSPANCRYAVGGCGNASVRLIESL